MFSHKRQIVLSNLNVKRKMPTYLLERDHGIVFSENEQRGVLQTVDVFGIPDEACREGSGAEL